MVIEQTFPVDAIRRGQNFWRLRRQAVSSGDIFESSVSAKGFAVGPESDISRYTITYRDPSQASEVSSIEVSSRQAFSGNIEASGSNNYQSGQPANILITYGDTLPRLSGGAIDEAIRVPSVVGEGVVPTIYNAPRVDLIQYLSPNVQPPTKRSDLVIRKSRGNGLGEFQELVPFYGRRFLSASYNNITEDALDLAVFGINLSDIYPGDTSYAQYRELGTETVAADGSHLFQIENVSFDYIGIHVASAASILPRTITCSDVAG